MKQIADAMPFEEIPVAVGTVSVGSTLVAQQRLEDPLRRFTPTPFNAALPVMGRVVRLETNSARILEHMVKVFARYPSAPNGHASFLWRIVGQSHIHPASHWPKRSAFSDRGLRFAAFGQRNFLAVDTEAREAIGFVCEDLLEDSPFVDTLFYMTASCLGLVSVVAACVALGTRGLLVLGSPNQGKTTASYLASKAGLNYHADHAVCLEVGSQGLQAWGDFVPVAFRPETLEFLPELKPMTRRVSYGDVDFYYVDRNKFNSMQVDVVAPVGCVVLERECDAIPRLVPLSEPDLSKCLSESLAFKEGDRFEEQRGKIFEALMRLPAYHLAYGSDPAIAAIFIKKLLR
jgi:hypothetical protein